MYVIYTLYTRARERERNTRHPTVQRVCICSWVLFKKNRCDLRSPKSHTRAVYVQCSCSRKWKRTSILILFLIFFAYVHASKIYSQFIEGIISFFFPLCVFLFLKSHCQSLNFYFIFFSIYFCTMRVGLNWLLLKISVWVYKLFLLITMFN